MYIRLSETLIWSVKIILFPFWFSGDGKNYTANLKTRLNGKLDEGKDYMVFQRAYLNVYQTISVHIFFWVLIHTSQSFSPEQV